VPYVVPVASAWQAFDADGQIQEQAVGIQLETLGQEVMLVADRFATHESPDHQAECNDAAERIAAAAVA
jgi:hypothetical protein